jgi:hypothetical protein
MPRTSGALVRLRAASHVTRALLTTLDSGDVVDSVDPSEDRLAGVRRVGDEVVLPPALVAELADWLRQPQGFDDRVVRRCERQNGFGFRLVREVSGLEAEVSEIAIDLNCNSIAIVNQEGERRRRADAFFDTSRPAALALLRAAMPGSARALPVR